MININVSKALKKKGSEQSAFTMHSNPSITATADAGSVTSKAILLPLFVENPSQAALDVRNLLLSDTLPGSALRCALVPGYAPGTDTTVENLAYETIIPTLGYLPELVNDEIVKKKLLYPELNNLVELSSHDCRKPWCDFDVVETRKTILKGLLRAKIKRVEEPHRAFLRDMLADRGLSEGAMLRCVRAPQTKGCKNKSSLLELMDRDLTAWLTHIAKEHEKKCFGKKGSRRLFGTDVKNALAGFRPSTQRDSGSLSDQLPIVTPLVQEAHH
jgi:hypothetical protein